MAKVIGIMGESGSGKTTSMRNLDPATTFYIDCDKKGLSWKGWREQYNADKNYKKTDDPTKVLNILQRIEKNEEGKSSHIKTIIIDTLNGIMVADEMRRTKEKGYDKWQDLAQSIYFIVDYTLSMREDLTVILICHSQTEKEEDGTIFTRIKTNGKRLEKIVLESKMTTVLHALVKDGEYIFRTKANNSTCKTPLGAFEEAEIENDIVKVLEVLKEF